jgi:hypothetical protein
MKYSGRALRIIDIAAMAVTGVGILCLLLTAYTLILLGDMGPGRYGQDPRLWTICYATLGITFTCLGAALNIQLIRVRANRGCEPGRGECGFHVVDRGQSPGGESSPP